MHLCSIHLENGVFIVPDKVWHLVKESMHLGMSDGMANHQTIPYSPTLLMTRNKFFFRLIGLCLLQNELFPLFLQRHVLKYILGRTIRFHDLAFFDPVVFESLRQLVTDSTGNAASVLSDLELNFE